MRFTSKRILAIFLLQILCTCASKTEKSSHSQSATWEKLVIFVGILLVIIAVAVYLNRSRQLRVTEIIRGYLSTNEEVTFMNINHSPGPQMIEEIASESIIEKSSPIDEDKTKIQQDNELSIDNQDNETPQPQLTSVFQKQQDARNKKSKSRKRLANTAKVTQQEDSNNLSPSEDI